MGVDLTGGLLRWQDRARWAFSVSETSINKMKQPRAIFRPTRACSTTRAPRHMVRLEGAVGVVSGPSILRDAAAAAARAVEDGRGGRRVTKTLRGHPRGSLCHCAR